MDQAQIIGISIGVGAVVLMLLLVFIKANIVICQPNEVVILSGRQHKGKDGSLIGYRIIRGGRGFKWPLIESAKRLPLTTRTIDVRLTKALCAGMIPVSIEGRANVKLAGSEAEGIERAVERFLGKGIDAVERTAQQVLEGALRGVIASVSPEEANSKRLDMAKQVVERAREDLSNLGIVLDFFQIQDLSDEQGYLEAIGRKRNAEVRRDARIAEAESEAEARRVSAEQERIGREAEIASQQAILKHENALAVERANLLAEANRAEERAKVAGDIARTEQKVDLEAKRIDLQVKREEANTIVPAKAKREAMMLEAEGYAARILEDGRATAQAVEMMKEQYGSGETHDLFLIQMLPKLTDKVTRVLSENLNVEKLTILDGGDGNGLPNYVKNLTNSVVVMLEQMKNATGVDVTKLSRGDDHGVPKQIK